MSRGFLFGSSIALTISIIVLALSTYGLGREEKNKASSNYKAAETFTIITIVTTIISLFVLVIAILRTPGIVASAQSFQAPRF